MVRRGKKKPIKVSEVESPCVLKCNLINFDENVCFGCFRSIEEIRRWSFMTDEEKLEVLQRISQSKGKLNGS